MIVAVQSKAPSVFARVLHITIPFPFCLPVPECDHFPSVAATKYYTIQSMGPSVSLELWCRSSRHHQNRIAKIGGPVLVLFLIPLTETFLSMVGINLPDRFFIPVTIEGVINFGLTLISPLGTYEP